MNIYHTGISVALSSTGYDGLSILHHCVDAFVGCKISYVLQCRRYNNMLSVLAQNILCTIQYSIGNRANELNTSKLIYLFLRKVVVSAVYMFSHARGTLIDILCTLHKSRRINLYIYQGTIHIVLYSFTFGCIIQVCYLQGSTNNVSHLLSLHVCVCICDSVVCHHPQCMLALLLLEGGSQYRAVRRDSTRR